MAEKGLTRWFKEKWTKPNGEACGSDKGTDDAKCRPGKRITNDTPVTWSELSSSEKKKAIASKNKANREGKQFSDVRFSKIKKRFKPSK